MTKRDAILAILAIPLAAWDAFAQSAPGVLKLDLERWSRLEVRYRGRTAVVTADEIFKALLVFVLSVTPLSAQTRPSPEDAVSVLLGSRSELNRTGVGDWEAPAPSVTVVPSSPSGGPFGELHSTPITPSYRGPFRHWAPLYGGSIMRGRYGDALPPALYAGSQSRDTLHGLHRPTRGGTPQTTSRR